jgi:hypothetical protein
VEREKAYPSSGMNCILVRMLARFCNQMWNVMYRDDPIDTTTKNKIPSAKQFKKGSLIMAIFPQDQLASFAPLKDWRSKASKLPPVIAPRM